MISACAVDLSPLACVSLMPDAANPLHLLEEIDKRQDDVLNSLDELNLRIELVIKDILGQHKDAA